MRPVNDFPRAARIRRAFGIGRGPESDGQNATRRAVRTRGGMRNEKTRPYELADYDLSRTGSDSAILGEAHAKGDDGTGGSNSARRRRTLPHCGQRAGSAGGRSGCLAALISAYKGVGTKSVPR